MKNLKYLVALLTLAFIMPLSSVGLKSEPQSAEVYTQQVETLLKELAEIEHPSVFLECGKEGLIFLFSAVIAGFSGIFNGFTKSNPKQDMQKMLFASITRTSIVYALTIIARVACNELLSKVLHKNLLNKNFAYKEALYKNFLFQYGAYNKLEQLQELLNDKDRSLLNVQKIKDDFAKLKGQLTPAKNLIAVKILRGIAILLSTLSLCELIVSNSKEKISSKVVRKEESLGSKAELPGYVSLIAPILGIKYTDVAKPAKFFNSSSPDTLQVATGLIKYDMYGFKVIGYAYKKNAITLIPCALAYLVTLLALSEGLEFWNQKITAKRLAHINALLEVRG